MTELFVVLMTVVSWDTRGELAQGERFAWPVQPIARQEWGHTTSEAQVCKWIKMHNVPRQNVYRVRLPADGGAPELTPFKPRCGKGAGQGDK